MKSRVHWQLPELDAVSKAFIAHRMKGEHVDEAIANAQKETLPKERWRATTGGTATLIRRYLDDLAKIPSAAPIPAPEPSPPAEPVTPPEPEPVAAEPQETPLRDLALELLVDAGRILLADEQFQAIAMHIGQRFLMEVLKTRDLVSQTATAKVPEPSGPRKPKVCVVGLLNGQASMIQREFGQHVSLGIVPKDHKGDQLRKHAEHADAVFVMKWSGHSEWNKANAWAGENTEVAFLTGIDKLRNALHKYVPHTKPTNGPAAQPTA